MNDLHRTAVDFAIAGLHHLDATNASAVNNRAQSPDGEHVVVACIRHITEAQAEALQVAIGQAIDGIIGPSDLRLIESNDDMVASRRVR